MTNRSESDIDNTPLLKSIKTEVKEAKTHLPFAYDFLDAVLVRHGHEGYKDEVIKLFQQHDYNGDVFKSNLLRSLTKYDKNAGSFLGYLANSLKEDWAREDRIQEEAQQQAEQKILEAEQQNKQAETERQEAYQKEMQEFRKYFDSLPVAERERLWQQAESKVTFAPHNEELKKMVIFEEVKELVQAAKEAIPA